MFSGKVQTDCKHDFRSQDSGAGPGLPKVGISAGRGTQVPDHMMIENYLISFLWDLMKRCPHIVRGLKRAGFRGGWLGDV